MSVFEKMVFDDIELIEVPVEIKGQQYLLRELSGGGSCVYRDAMLEQAEFDEEGHPVKLSGIAQAELILLSQCLFKVEPTGPVPVDLEALTGFPQRITNKLIAKAKEISGMELVKGDENPT